MDGKITEGYYERISNQWNDEAKRCERDLVPLREASESYMDEGVALLHLAHDAHNLFEKHPGASRKKLVNFVLSNCTWSYGKLTAELREPFNLLEEKLGGLSITQKPKWCDDAEKDNWLGN